MSGDWEVKPVRIVTSGRGMVLEAKVKNGLAVHEEIEGDDKWCITHVRSGQRLVGGGMESSAIARDVAEEMLKRRNWDVSKGVIMRHKEKAQRDIDDAFVAAGAGKARNK